MTSSPPIPGLPVSNQPAPSLPPSSSTVNIPINTDINTALTTDTARPSLGVVGDSSSGLITNSHPSTTSATNSAATATSTQTSDNGSGGLPVPIIIAIAVPIGTIILLAPIIYIIWVRYRTRNMNKLESEPRYSPSPSKEPKFRAQSPNPPATQAFLPPLFHERGQTKEGSLFDEVRISMDSTRRNQPVGHFDRARDEYGAKESSYNVYDLRRSLEDKGRTDSIGLFDLSRNNTDRSSPSMQPQQRGPSPTLPSPNVPLFDRPPSEAWPLPASKLPAPQSLYDPYINTNKPLPTSSMLSSAPPNMPLPAPPGSRQENRPNAFGFPNAMPPQNTQEYRPSSSGRQGTNQLPGSLMSGTGHESASSSRYASPEQGQGTFNPMIAGEHRSRQRDSDLVSELSFRSPSSERDPKRRSTDAISVVSAISHRKRRSERDADALSMVSALSPEQDETPRIPIEHYPR